MTVLSDSGFEETKFPEESGRGDVFTIHATRNDQSMVTHRIIPDVAVAQARVLNDAGWRVRISGLGGKQFAPSEFHHLLTYDRIG